MERKLGAIPQQIIGEKMNDESEKQTAVQQMQERYNNQIKQAIISGTGVVGPSNGSAINQGTPPQNGMWNNAALNQVYDKMQAAKRSTESNITIREVENGRVVSLNGKAYVCPQGTPLLDIIGQALVEAQLEK
jgi:hypothetical protein